MRQHVAHRDALFAMRGKFRPVVGNRCLVAHKMAISQDVQTGGRHALTTRRHVEERVGIDTAAAGFVGEAGSRVDNQLVGPVDSYLQAQLGLLRDKLVEHILDFAIWIHRLKHLLKRTFPFQ
jgi:hypothetical protein